MSFKFNSDREQFRAISPALIGESNLTIRSGSGVNEVEIMRALTDPSTGLPRVGINRTGSRVDRVVIDNEGSGYTQQPTVLLDPPPVGGVQALASAVVSEGRVRSIIIDNAGDGYTTAPGVTISGGDGQGATATAFLDSVDFELDINGAIRTSTSIISDTARILNLDIDNIVTPDAALRAPNLKTFINNTGTPWAPDTLYQKNTFVFRGPNVYQSLNVGTSDASPLNPPLHIDGIETNGTVQFKHIGFRVSDENEVYYGETGEAGLYPRSITPLLGDKSDKIATTEYVLNLATNDVGGRIYVSQLIGNDENDGRSAVNPVRTIKKACQLAWATPGVKESIIISGGDYVEDNPISIPPDASIVGDNLRLVIIRPANPRKHIFKFGDKNYVIGVTYRDQVDSDGFSVATWDFAMVFDDKQRITYDHDVNGDFDTSFPIGHQIFGESVFEAVFQSNGGLSSLTAGQQLRGVNAGGIIETRQVNFNTTTGNDAYVNGTFDFVQVSGSVDAGETLVFGGPNTERFQPNFAYTLNTFVWTEDHVYQVTTAGTSGEDNPIHDTGAVGNGPDTLVFTYVRDTYSLVTTDIKSIRAEGEVVFEDRDISTVLPISRIDFSKQGTAEVATGGFGDYGVQEDLGGIIFYTNPLVEADNIHDFKEGQEIEISGLSTNAPDLSFLMGKQRIYKVIEDPDGRSRRFVIPKKEPSLTNDNYDPGQFAQVTNYSKSVTLSLLNSPNKFLEANWVARRFQDAVNQIRNNREFIADEVVSRINDEFKQEYFFPYEISGTPDQTFTPTDVTYDPATGLAVFTVNGHGLSNGDGVRIADDSIVFTCGMDGNKTEHVAPQSHHFAYGKTLPITNVTTNTFTIDVGESGPDQQFTPIAASYNPANGELVLDLGAPHTLDIGEGIVIDDNSLSFTCDMDNNQSTKTYPRPGIDPYAGRSIPITAVDKAAGTITLNVGASAPNRTFQPQAGTTYDAATGDLVMNLGPQHGLGVGRSVVLADNSFTFTCDQDGNVEQKTYPRPGQDPYAGKSIPITNVSTSSHTPTDAPYDAATGVVTFQVNSHGFNNGDYIKIDDNSLTYTCVLDGNTVNKTYPRAGYDYPSGRWLEVSNVTANTFDVNIGPSSYTGAHTFVSAATNAIKRQTGFVTINVGNAGTASGSLHVFISATANAVQHLPQSNHTFTGATSNSIKHLPQSAHTFVRADANSLIVGGSEFKIYLGTSRFVHTYVSGGTVTFQGTTANVTNFVYDNIVTGEATITIDTPLPALAEDVTIQLAGLVVECVIDGVTTQKTYPSFNIPVSDEKCRRDVKHFINAITADLEFGSNNNVIDAARKYIDGTNTEITFVDNEIIQTVRALEYTRELCIYAMRKWRTGTGLVTDPVYTPVYSSLPRYFDPTVIDDLSPGGACVNVKNAIDTLAFLYVDVLANNTNGTYLDAAYLIARNRHAIADEAYEAARVQYPSLSLNNVDERKCRRDINFILSALIRDLSLGGNTGIVTAAESYFTGAGNLTGIPASELGPTVYAFNEVRDLAIAAMRNWKDASGNAVSFTYTSIPQFTDSTILPDLTGNPLCASVESTISASFLLLQQILEETIAVGATTKTTGTLFDVAGVYNYASSVITDANGVKVTVRATYDDLPIIEASPYTQNSSIISKLGGGGALIDGSKVKQPNCPFPGLTVEGTAKFPNQGKSMVASAFTIVSEGGIGYKIIEDGYTQLVSVFCIFTADGVLADTGGYASITNSATNFGIFALRATGFRREAYDFDVATITNVSATPTGRTIFSLSGLGREPLEHYVVKIDGYQNLNPDIEYFVDVVDQVTVGPPFSAQITLESGAGGGAELIETATGNPVALASLVGATVRLHRPSIVNSSSHTWEYAGSGTSYLALPENGGVKVEANEQVSENYGRTYVSGTDELGDFKVGTFARIENRTGNITFTGTVTISEVEFLKLKGGDVVVTGFDNSNTLGGANATDSKLPTQKAVKDFITNNLGPFINKPYSTNPVPRALVELTDSGKISEDQIPPLRPFQVFTVANQAERVAIEGALAGDIAIEQDTNTSFILNNDTDSLFAAFAVDTTLQFTIGDIFTGSLTGGKIQSTEYRQGVLYQINITDGGSGYVTPPIITISGNQQAGGVPAVATATIANGQVVIVTIELSQGYVGGKGYQVPPTITIAAPAGSGTQATATGLIESRLYGDIVNNIKIDDTDTIDSSDLPAEVINITRVVNTSGSNANNWVSLSSNQIAASDITSGVISTARLASNAQGAESAANSFTFLRGDQSYQPAVQTIKGPETRYFASLTQQANSGSSTLIFEGSSKFLLGHSIEPITGIQTDTNISGVLTEEGETTVTIDKFLTATLPAGTVIEFDRGRSPLTFESSQTEGGFVDQIVIQNGGSGFDAGPFFNVPLTGGNGVGLRVNIITTGGVVTDVTIVDGGQDYGQNTSQQNVDFIVSSTPTEIGSGSGLILLAKVTTVLRQYANVAVDIDRVTNLTTSGDAYGTLGVARFRKSQFVIGQSGNGSIDINTGPDSGLDADTLDGAQGSFYLNAGNMNAGVLPVDRLSGTYNISIANQSGNTLRLKTSTGSPTGNPAPNEFSAGIIADTKNNTADGLFDGGTRHMVLTIRNGGSDFDATFGGVRQLAITDGDPSKGGGNLWLRGSHTSPANPFGNWNLIWHSANDGELSGLDADMMDGRQGKWYQTATHINYGIFSDLRIPELQTKKKFLEELSLVDWTGQDRYFVLVRDEILGSAAPFLAGLPVNLYDTGGNGVGELTLTKVETNLDANDPANNYTLLTGSLTSGDFVDSNGVQVAYFIGEGGVANAYAFQDYGVAQLDDNGDGTIDGSYEVAKLESSAGNARLKLGRADGQAATDPSIYFRSSQIAATNYNSAIIASGGNNTNGSGLLEVKVADADGMTILGQKIWNAGNITFNSTNVVGTGVIRDSNGDFAAGTITAALTGAASANVLKAGDTMSGSLTIGGIAAANQALEVSGRADFLSNITVAADLAVATDTLFVDTSQETVGINAGTSLTAGLSLDIKGGSEAALRLQGTRGSHHLYLDSRNDYKDDGSHVWIWISDGDSGGAFPGEGGHLVLNGRAQDRDIILRTNSSNKLTVGGTGGVVISNSGSNDGLTVDNMIVGNKGLTLGTTANNDDAPIYFLGATGASDGAGGRLSNFRVGNGIIGGDIFEITANTAGGATTWSSTPALAIQGTNNRVAINTTAFSGVDNSDPSAPITRDYNLNVQGDININGILYQNNEPFVTSRWTEAPNTIDIYRTTKVGINFQSAADPREALDVEGDIYMTGTIKVNGQAQWLDTYGVIKVSRSSIDEDVTIPTGNNGSSTGPITVASGFEVTVSNGATWIIT